VSDDTRVAAHSRTLFQIFDPGQVEEGVVRAEPEILEGLAEPEFIRTGIENVDYLVDQWRFAKAGLADAERRGLRGLAALEWTSYLSWPECRRQAEPRWRQDLLRRYAFEEPAPFWQGTLHAHSSDDAARLVGPPRKHVWLPPKLLFGPYPSKWGPTALAPACLEADITFDTWTTPGPLTPVRRLTPALTWVLRIAAMRLYAGSAAFSEVIVDEPRTYSAPEARDVLLAHAQEWETTLEAATTGSTPLATDAAAQWRKSIDELRAEADVIIQAGKRDRATLLELLFRVPGTIWLTPVDVLTDDLPPEWFGVMLGFAFERRGVLSVRERGQLRRATTAVFDVWQTTRYPDREIMPERTSLIVDRLTNLRRLLQPASLFAYLAQLTRRHRRGRDRGE
jgi:hypothetical protein